MHGQASTYTALAVAGLERRRMLVSSNGMRSLGGPGSVTAAILDRVFSRFSAYVRLAAKSIEAEFPHWETLQAKVWGFMHAGAWIIMNEATKTCN